MQLLYLYMGFGLILLLVRFFTVIFHELGHAIPALIFTKDNVTVYLGSYGDEKDSTSVRTGRLEIWFKHSLFWNAGLCVSYSKNISKFKNFIEIIGGPIASLFLSSVCVYCAFVFGGHGFFKLIFIVFLCSSLFDFFVNIIPLKISTAIHGGKVVYNDGMQLIMLFNSKLAHKYTHSTLSQNTKDLIVRSREIALDLGCEYISTMHMAIADCLMLYNCSIRKLMFDTDEELDKFYELMRVGESLDGNESLPLTVEAEKTIQDAGQLARRMQEGKLQPYHIFIAASQSNETLFYKHLSHNTNLHNLLIDFYAAIKAIDQDAV